MAYLLLFTSFLIVWIETWYLEFRVLPEEDIFRGAWGKCFIFGDGWYFLLLAIFLCLMSFIINFKLVNCKLSVSASSSSSPTGEAPYHTPFSSHCICRPCVTDSQGSSPRELFPDHLSSSRLASPRLLSRESSVQPVSLSHQSAELLPAHSKQPAAVWTRPARPALKLLRSA